MYSSPKNTKEHMTGFINCNTNKMKRLSGLVLFIVMLSPFSVTAQENGSNLWLRYSLLPGTLPQYYTQHISQVTYDAKNKSNNLAFDELVNAYKGLTGIDLSVSTKIKNGSLLMGTSKDKAVTAFIDASELDKCGEEGFLIKSVTIKTGQITVLASNSEVGLLYGVFELIRQIQTGASITALNISEAPSYRHRILNHWDNLDGTVERGYAGHSLWKWDELPDTISPRYAEYARANASIGINGTVLNNVNAKPEILSLEYLEKIKIIAEALRPYGIRVYLAINFSSPKAIGGLETADPFNQDVIRWWKDKADEIYRIIPDFGGFLVKAFSEGLPGPQTYGRTHADGANMLADALAPHGGIVMWRAFVYGGNGEDRAKQAYNEFVPFDGKFRKNVMIQVKNGPIDFQPREPVSPLFGAMKHTTLMPELQITKEYLGFSDHLAYLGTLFEEFLDFDTYNEGKNTTIARVTDGSIFNDSITGIAGVANVGEDANWCGHHFDQANWYVFGRLAWNNQLSAKEISVEWLKQTFSHDQSFIDDLSKVMMQSREAVVNYMTPIGLAHLMGYAHHYGPTPWCCGEFSEKGVWYPVYYHRSDSLGIGFNRTTTGHNSVSQYAEPLRSMYNDPKLCPENLLLWFHHLPWDYTMRNGNDLWTELCYKYSSGVDDVRRFQNVWVENKEYVDPQRYEEVKNKLAIQAKEAQWWRDVCLLYFQTYSKRPIPSELEQPIYNLQEERERRFDLKVHN